MVANACEMLVCNTCDEAAVGLAVRSDTAHFVVDEVTVVAVAVDMVIYA
jgi:hypothetical protein